MRNHACSRPLQAKRVPITSSPALIHLILSQALSERLIVVKHLPNRNTSAVHHRPPGRRSAPTIVRSQFAVRRIGAPRYSSRNYQVPISERFLNLNRIIGHHRKISRPTLAHRLATTKLSAERIHKQMILRHQPTKVIHIPAIDGVYKLVKHFDGSHR